MKRAEIDDLAQKWKEVLAAGVEPGEDWKLRGACAQPGINPNIFYPDKDSFPLEIRRRAAEEQAVRLCGSCSVRSECLIWALAGPEKHGIWGGLTEKDRRGVLRRSA